MADPTGKLRPKTCRLPFKIRDLIIQDPGFRISVAAVSWQLDQSSTSEYTPRRFFFWQNGF